MGGGGGHILQRNNYRAKKLLNESIRKTRNVKPVNDYFRLQEVKSFREVFVLSVTTVLVHAKIVL